MAQRLEGITVAVAFGIAPTLMAMHATNGTARHGEQQRPIGETVIAMVFLIVCIG